MADIAQGMVVFGPRELAEFLGKEYGLRPPPKETATDLEHLAGSNPRTEEVFAVVAFALHLGMKGQDILAAVEALE